MKYNKYILELSIFTCGAVVMIFELVGSRVLGPYFGTSIFVWTNLIGIILGSLSLGYYLGGKIADRKPNLGALSLIVFLAAICIGLTAGAKDFLLVFLQSSFADIRTASAFATLILFSPASVLLGMVSPYVVKLKMEDLDTAGKVAGNLYAISTAGSIAGTFLSGFYLIPHLGTSRLLVILSLALVFVSMMLSVKKYFKIKAIVLLIALSTVGNSDSIFAKKGIIDVDTPYNRIWIHDDVDYCTSKTIRIMGINNENHSAMFLDGDELVNKYTEYYHLVAYFNPDFDKALMLGGAGYSYPKDFLLKYPEAKIDVVEIDPGITGLARKYFKLIENSRLTIYHEDGRVYLNKTQKKYDAIFGDAFGSRYSLPYQMTTREAVQKEYDMLNDNGVAIVNIISSVEGDRGKFLRAEYVTYKSIFPQVYLFPVAMVDDGEIIQNIMLVALKSGKTPDFTSGNPKLNSYLQHLWKKDINTDMPILTDDYAPVDSYIEEALR